jgi:hypothetical protein
MQQETGTSALRQLMCVYEMSLGDGVWKIWREAPGFHQRFTGTSADGETITAQWESSQDGVEWKPDFDVVYTKIK